MPIHTFSGDTTIYKHFYFIEYFHCIHFITPRIQFRINFRFVWQIVETERQRHTETARDIKQYGFRCFNPYSKANEKKNKSWSNSNSLKIVAVCSLFDLRGFFYSFTNAQCNHDAAYIGQCVCCPVTMTPSTFITHHQKLNLINLNKTWTHKLCDGEWLSSKTYLLNF